MQKRVLIVEDDDSINQMIQEALKKQGYDFTPAYSGTEALLYKDKKWDVIILDLMLPGCPGQEVLKQFKEKQDTPVLVLSALDSMDSKLSLLTSGADDYMTKPFNLDEMLARLDILTRRSNSSENAHLLRYHDLELDSQAFQAQLGGEDLDLTKSEFRILELLLKHPLQVFTKQEIYEYVMDDAYMGSETTINVHISNLRKKISKLSSEEYIETVWGIGFKLKS